MRGDVGDRRKVLRLTEQDDCFVPERGERREAAEHTDEREQACVGAEQAVILNELGEKTDGEASEDVDDERSDGKRRVSAELLSVSTQQVTKNGPERASECNKSETQGVVEDTTPCREHNIGW